MIGVVGINIEILLGTLGLPAASGFHRSFTKIESSICRYKRKEVLKSLDDALEREIWMTLDEEYEEE